MKRTLLALALVTACTAAATATAAANEIGFVEDYVLAQNKADAIKNLIPGTDEHYYYQCLHHQAVGRYDQVEDLLKAWLARRKGHANSLIVEIQNRQALLTYKADPDKSLAYLRRKLGLRFDHRPQIATTIALPTKLDPASVSREAFINRAWAHNSRDSLSGFEDAALAWLDPARMKPRVLRMYLDKLTRPDRADIVDLVLKDLAEKDSRGFGSVAIHKKLLKAQLDELLKRKGDLIRSSAFVQAYTARLRPGEDVAWQREPKAKRAYLDRLWNFVKGLDPAFNSLKANVMYHRLALDHKQGAHDKGRFLEYIKLPRRVSYWPVPTDRHELNAYNRYAASLSYTDPQINMHAIGNDEPLVRAYLMDFFADADGWEPYDEYIRDSYLKKVFAEAKLLAGAGKAEKWTAMLSPSEYKALSERVELDFAPDSEKYFRPDQKVELSLDVKNVKTLIVKVFRVNALKYYQQTSQAVPLSLDLDGLVANVRQSYKYDESPLRRVRRTFALPQLDSRGVYVVELIGGGKRSRAMIQKGKLAYVSHITPAGQEFTVLDENNKKLPNARIWMAGRYYDADKDGTITLPLSTNPGEQKIILVSGDAATLTSFRHQSERYGLQCGFHVPREALVAGRKATVMVRPQLTLAGKPVSLKLLKDVKLILASKDINGVSSTKTVDDFPIFEDRESTFEFRVPRRVVQIGFALTAKVKNITQGKEQSLSASQTVALNHIDRTDVVEYPYVLRTPEGYVLEIRGRNGELLTDRPVRLSFKARGFSQQYHTSLKTDRDGRVLLGRLEGIEKIFGRDARRDSDKGFYQIWEPVADAHDMPAELQGKAGDTLVVPYTGKAGKPTRGELSLLEVRGGNYVADWFEALRIRDGLLTISDLPAGDYSLRLKYDNRTIPIRLAEGVVEAGHVCSGARRLEISDVKPMQIASVSAEGKSVTIKLVNANPLTRVHVLAARYMPQYDAMGMLAPFGRLGLAQGRVEKPASFYEAGRKISDEYRYILDRQSARKWPGNMLPRPSLILNPWSPRSADTGKDAGRAGEMLQGLGDKLDRGSGRSFYGSGGRAAQQGNMATMDFLANGAVVLLNLEPDKSGTVTIPRKVLLDKQQLRILAVDTLHTALRELTLDEVKPALRDRRLDKATALDPASHYVQEKVITPLAKGEAFTFQDAAATRFEIFDSVERAYRLMVTLNGDAALKEFAFITDWPTLTDEQKRQKYSKYACHEMHLFLSKRDPAFFKAVVRPYLENKKDKTFMDEYLLGMDVSRHLRPWRYSRLNIAERILLADRIAGERKATARAIKDLHDLLRPDPDRFNMLFDTALGLTALEAPAEEKASGDADFFENKPGSLNGVRITAGSAKLKALAERKRSRESTSGRVRYASSETAAAPTVPAAPKPAALAAPSRTMREADTAKKEHAAFKSRNGSVKGVDEVSALGFDAKKMNEAEKRVLYRKIGQVKEWVENNYYRLPNDRAGAGLVAVNAFWRDYAARKGDGGFVSGNFAEASRNVHEILLALALLDLPFEARQHEIVFDGPAMTVKPATNAILFHEQITEAASVPKIQPILVSQNYYRAGERYKTVEGEQVDNFITDEFLAGEPYACHVVVTNPTSIRRKCQVLVQIPRGAVELSGGKRMRTIHIELDPYHTRTFDYFFYFPEPGKFGHFPVHVSRRGELVGFAEARTLNVVAELTKVDTASWEYVSQRGSDEDVMAFLRNNNLGRISLSKIAWRMRDREMFDAVIRLLSERHAFDGTLWSYAIHHNRPEIISQYLPWRSDLVGRCGQWIESPLLNIQPVVRKAYEHKEYWPLVNARAHLFGAKRKILVAELHRQYTELLNILRYKKQLSDDDQLAMTYYLLTQDRVDEAMKMFAAVDAGKLAERMQYDYVAAYLAFYSEKPDKARKIAAKYAEHPVKRWRGLFGAVIAQVDEIEGKAPAVVNDESRDEKMTQLASAEATFEFKVEARKIELSYQNLASVQVNYYLMDIEQMFSSQPFVSDRGGQLAFIEPNLAKRVALPQAQKAKGKGPSTATIDLPAELANSNVIVEVVGAGKTRTQAYYSNSLTVQVMESYGQLRVMDKKGKALARTYVKVYARMKNGKVEFYKDGYTDLRGRFDYSSLNTNQLAGVDKFAVLVLSESSGSTVKEAAPPKQ